MTDHRGGEGPNFPVSWVVVLWFCATMNLAHRPVVDLMSRGEKCISAVVARLSPLARRVTLIAALGLVALLSGCSRTEERQVNAWLKVRVRTPERAGGGMVQIGPDARVWVFVKVDGHWRRLAEGRKASVMRLKNDHAVLLVVVDERMHGDLLFMKEGDSAGAPIRRFFSGEGMLSVPPSGARLDWVQGEDGDITKGFSRLILWSCDLNGHVTGPRTLTPPDVDNRPGCFVSAIVTCYDLTGNPYFRARPQGSDWHGPYALKGVLPEGERVFAPAPQELPDWRKVVGRAMVEPKKFYPFPGNSRDVIPP